MPEQGVKQANHLPLIPRRGTRSGRVSLERGDADGSAGARSRLDPDGTQPPPRTLALNFFFRPPEGLVVIPAGVSFSGAEVEGVVGHL